MATISVLLTQPPYSTQLATDGLEFALASTNYGHQCKVIFSGKGVLQLLGSQAPTAQKSQLKQIKVLPFYDIEPVYVCQASLAALQLSVNDLGINAEDMELLTPTALREVLGSADHTVTF